MKVVRYFTCLVSGDKCAIVLNGEGQEICLLASEIN